MTLSDWDEAILPRRTKPEGVGAPCLSFKGCAATRWSWSRGWTSSSAPGETWWRNWTNWWSCSKFSPCHPKPSSSKSHHNNLTKSTIKTTFNSSSTRSRNHIITFSKFSLVCTPTACLLMGRQICIFIDMSIQFPSYSCNSNNLFHHWITLLYWHSCVSSS